jgi:hypothetical protein
MPKEYAVYRDGGGMIESPDARPLGVPVQTIERSSDRIEDVGLRLGEAKLPGLMARHRSRVRIMPTE